MPHEDVFNSRALLPGDGEPLVYYRLKAVEEAGLGELTRLPYSIRVLLETLLRQVDGVAVTREDVERLAAWDPSGGGRFDIPFKPARVVLQDFTGVPAVVDLAAMRSALARSGGDPKRVNPLVPVDLVIDHSVQVDRFGSRESLRYNAELEFERNRERYELLKWAQGSFSNFRVVPPSTGIVHQVNLEYLAGVVLTRNEGGRRVVFSDTLVGTDSHTTMINGLGVLGWGVGGIEAEAVMLDQPLYLVTPEVVGFELTGRLPAGATATDLVLTVTRILRARGVVDEFVEFFGPGVSSLSLPDRATLANMAPEYGATVGFFPVDEETLRYLTLSGRSREHVELVERYARAQGLFRSEDAPVPAYSDILSLDMATVEPSLAGPKRPQDRIALSGAARSFAEAFPQASPAPGTELGHGSVVIAAITSCTNTSNPSVMIGAGMLARKAVERGLRVKPWVKTSMAPGSTVVSRYLDEAGLTPHLEALGFHVVGYGCTTCIGNSGPLPADVAAAVQSRNLAVVSVLSGNRNFEGRIHPLVRANYLASPPLVVAYALAGTIDIDLTRDALGTDPEGRAVTLRDIWPEEDEIREAVRRWITPELFREQYRGLFSGNDLWKAIPAPEGDCYAFDPASTYIREPPYFARLSQEPPPRGDILCAKALAVFGDSVTTDHISPAGSIPADSPAGLHLIGKGVSVADFNQYGTRRGNHEVMVRGTFANIRIRNRLVPGTEGGFTVYQTTGEVLPIFEAAVKYSAEGTPTIVLAGKEYGTGSSRDWAAKGPYLLGVKAVIAESFERIHRSNLVGMGILPLQFHAGDNVQSLGLTGFETFDILCGPAELLQPGRTVTVRAVAPAGETKSFQAICRIDTPVEVEYYRNGGILQTVLRQMLR